MRVPVSAFAACMAAVVSSGCISYKSYTIELRDPSGRPLSNAVVEISPARYVMQFGARSSMVAADDQGMAEVKIPDTIGFRLRVWNASAANNSGWSECVVGYPEAGAGDFAIENYDGGTLRFHGQFVEGAAMSRNLYDGAVLVRSYDVYAAGHSSGGNRVLRTFETEDGERQNLVLHADQDGNAALVLGDTRVRIAGKDMHGRFLCPEVLTVIPVCDSDRRFVALQVFGRTVSERANCRGSGGSWTSEIEMLVVYSPQSKGFIPVGKDADALVQEFASPQAR